METQTSWNKFVSRSFFIASATMFTSSIALFTGHLVSGDYAMIMMTIGSAYYGKRWADTRAIPT